MRQSLNNSLHILKAGLIEMLQIGQNFLILAGIPVSILKKFRRCDAKVFADIEEDLHGREAVPIFERINVTGTLSDGQAPLSILPAVCKINLHTYAIPSSV